LIDWAENEIDAEDKLQWEDDWDEADIDDDFSAALRYASRDGRVALAFAIDAF